MQGGLRRGLHIDDDDEARKPDEYGGIDPSRKKGNFEKNLDDMLFGGGPAPVRRRPTGEKKQQVNTSKSKEAVKTQIKLEAVTAKVPEPAKAPQPLKSAKTSPNTSGNIKKEPSILAVADDKKGKDSDPTPTIGIISYPQINNYVDPNKSGSNKPQVTKTTQPVKPQPQKPVEAPQPQKPVEPSQPVQQVEQITVQVLHPFANRNKYNKPGVLRKGKKIAEDFKFSEENVTLNSAVDVVRPFQVDRARQRKLNDFDFHDFEFPASSLSLGTVNKNTPSVWKKPNEIAKTVNFGKYIDPNDFQAGSYSSPHFLSALSGIAQLETNTKRLIQDQKTNSNGFYLIRLFVNSVWRYIAVDNNLPYVNGQNAGVIGNTQGGELDIHSSLIQKAYAKSFGGYDVFSKTSPRQHYLRDLTGAPVKKYALDTPDLQNIVKKALASGQVVQAVPTEKIAALGVNPNYSYTVINFSAKGSLQLRNSWGTVEERSKTSFKSEGNFQISAGILRDHISHLLVTNLNPSYFTSTIQSKHRLGFYSTYSFKVKNPTHGFFTLSQWDDRLFPSVSNYSYSPATILIQKDAGDVELISANHTSGSRNLDLEVQLTPGDYTVFAAVNWSNGEHNFNLTFYGSQRIDFSRVYNDKNPDHIARSLEGFSVQSGRRVETSKTSAQYTSYHYESNFLLLTVENSSSREGRVNVDLSKIKLDKVTLISGHSNEQNYSQKVGYQIDDYKQAPLNDKRWGVNLEGGKRFTLVFAAKEAYNEANIKAWGFV